MIFENFEQEGNENQKLSFSEKAVITILIPFAKIILWKIGRAKTYGDLKKLWKLIEDRVEQLEKKYPESVEIPEEEKLSIITNEVEEFTKEIEQD